MKIKFITSPKVILTSVILFLFIVFVSTSACEAQTVYITKTGKKYHRESCRYLRYSSYQMSLADVHDRYEACLVCKPPDKIIGRQQLPLARDSSAYTRDTIRRPIQSAQENRTKSSAQRCTATTKAGNQCKRTTTSASGRCWQHE